MTQQEWDKNWMGYYDDMWMQTRSHDRSFTYAHKKMLADFGPRPDGELGPPWWLKVAALTLGVNMQKIWDWFDGKKVIIGAIITGLTTIAGLIPGLLPFFGVSAVITVKIIGVATTVLGLAHKFYKFIYKEEHP